MKSYALFQEYIWLVNTLHKANRLSLEQINQRWLCTEMSEGVPIARSTFNRHRDAILARREHHPKLDAFHFVGKQCTGRK